MKLIEKVEIHRFRSISDINIKTEEVTIFSGINNSGKSNVLRALNLFFNGRSNFDQEYNFSKDYNLAYTGQARGQRIIKIVLHFGPQAEEKEYAKKMTRDLFEQLDKGLLDEDSF
jgi:predicted ATP-dependent endonuclease of OLD family